MGVEVDRENQGGVGKFNLPSCLLTGHLLIKQTHVHTQISNSRLSFQNKVWDLDSSRTLTLLSLTTMDYCTTPGQVTS